MRILACIAVTIPLFLNAMQKTGSAANPILPSMLSLTDETNSAKRIVLQPRQGKMGCSARVPNLGDQVFALGIPETIGSRERMILNFPEVTIRWDGPDEDGVIATTWTTEGRIRYTTRLLPAVDYVDVEMTIENLADAVWHDVFAFNCLNPVNARQFKDWELRRTYMSEHGRPVQMAETKRVHGHMPTVGFYLHERIPWGKESPFVRGFHATSPNRTDGSWIVTLSDPPGSYMAATSPSAVFLFDNLDRCCIHSAADFGDIGPGESSTTVCRLYFAHGSLEDFLDRYRTDTTTLADQQKPAQPPRPRIQLRGVDSPPKGRKGHLAFEIRAPWMRGFLQMRFPETLRSSLGLHFIDHDRRDMPQLSELPSFPTWQHDEDTGEVMYVCRAVEGVEFSGRARPYEEEVSMEFRVANHTMDTLKGVSPQMCLSMAQSPDFNQQGDVANTSTWIDGEWTSLQRTTPSAADKGLTPWLQVLTRSAPEYAGPRDNRDGWWFVDQKADHGIIARTSENREHVVAIMWDKALAVSTNSRIPCLHAGPSGRATIRPGEEAAWRGKIYLMPNDPQALHLRCLGDSGVWPYPERQRAGAPRKEPRG